LDIKVLHKIEEYQNSEEAYDYVEHKTLNLLDPIETTILQMEYAIKRAGKEGLWNMRIRSDQ
jgi:hypothetical protein